MTGLEANLRFGNAGDHRDAYIRKDFRLAELDFHSAKRRGPQRRIKSLRQRLASEIQLGKSLVRRRGTRRRRKLLKVSSSPAFGESNDRLHGKNSE